MRSKLFVSFRLLLDCLLILVLADFSQGLTRSQTLRYADSAVSSPLKALCSRLSNKEDWLIKLPLDAIREAGDV